jgi:(p)ppGpp synthase/HD superfamily hydrolase
LASLPAAQSGIGEPYINHLLEGAALVAEATEGADPELVIAALLHDAIEDQEVPREVISAEFRERVAQIVEEVTDDKSLSKHQRKLHQVETAAEKSREARILKLADKTSNLSEMAVSLSSDWSVKRRLEYVKWARDVGAGLRWSVSFARSEI